MRRIIQQLKSLRHGEASPNPEWVAQNRATLLSQIKNTVPTTAARVSVRANKAAFFENVWAGLAIFMPRTMVDNFVRPVALLLIVALVGTSGWIASVDAAYEAQPGDFSYTVLRAAQKTQVAVAQLMGDKNGETKLHMQFAASLASKTRQLAQGDNPQKNAKLAVAVADLKSEINSLDSKLNETKNDVTGGKMQAAVARDVKQNTEQIKVVLQDVKNDLLASSSTPDANLAKAVNDTKDLVKDVSVKAVEVMVDKLTAGDTSVSETEVKQTLSNSLQSAASDVQDSKQTVDVVKTSVDTVKTELKDLSGAGAAQTGAVNSTKQIADQVSNIASSTTQAAVQASAASASVSQTVATANTFLTASSSLSSLTKVVDAIKEVNQVSKTTEKLSDNTILTAQTVLPIVGVVKDSSDLATPALSAEGSVSSSAAVVSAPAASSSVKK